MADKKIDPKNPSKDSAKQADSKAESRKTATFKIKRKSSGFKKFH